jgi:hypothetical protein
MKSVPAGQRLPHCGQVPPRQRRAGSIAQALDYDIGVVDARRGKGLTAPPVRRQRPLTATAHPFGAVLLLPRTTLGRARPGSDEALLLSAKIAFQSKGW